MLESPCRSPEWPAETPPKPLGSNFDSGPWVSPRVGKLERNTRNFSAGEFFLRRLLAVLEALAGAEDLAVADTLAILDALDDFLAGRFVEAIFLAVFLAALFTPGLRREIFFLLCVFFFFLVAIFTVYHCGCVQASRGGRRYWRRESERAS